MENSSKALLIAGGVLMAIMVVTLLVIGYNSITNYQRSKQSNMTQEQIAEFNKQYEAYNRDDVTGFELVSLINKVLSYNALNTVSTDSGEEDSWNNDNTDKAYTEMFIQFEITDTDLKELFDKGTYDTQKQSSKKAIEDIMNNMHGLENEFGTNVMSKLARMTNYYNENTNELNIEEINRVLGRQSTGWIYEEDLPSIKQVSDYERYINFKRANFECTGTDYDKGTGRIIKIIFEQK